MVAFFSFSFLFCFLLGEGLKHRPKRKCVKYWYKPMTAGVAAPLGYRYLAQCLFPDALCILGLKVGSASGCVGVISRSCFLVPLGLGLVWSSFAAVMLSPLELRCRLRYRVRDELWHGLYGQTKRGRR